MEGGVEVKDPSVLVVDDKPTVQDAQRGGRDREEVHGCNAVLVVAKESQPALDDIWGRRASWHVPRDGRLGDGQAQLLQFTVDSRSSPIVLESHSTDQLADLPVHSWPPWAPLVSGELGPIAPKALPMPLHDGLRLDEDESSCPAAPGPSHRDPEGSVRVVQLRPRSPALQHLHLLSQGEVLHNEIRPRPKDRSESPDQRSGEQHEQPEHGSAR